MSLKNWRKLSIGCLIGVFAIVTLFGCKHSIPEKTKPRVIVSSDIGGTDPDDFQSMIHLMMYSDIFQIEGIIASPYGEGRKENIWDIINLYEKDYDKLLKHSGDFPPPDSLRKICKQGATSGASFKGFTNPTEGSEWIIKCAKKERDQPLWILVWEVLMI